MEKYERLNMEIIPFESDDIIVTSYQDQTPTAGQITWIIPMNDPGNGE